MAKRNLPAKISQANFQTSPENIEINFSNISSVTFKAHNISRCVLSGEMTAKHKLNSANIIQSLLRGLKAQTSFYNGDIKDSKAENSEFTNCDFNESAHINNLFVDSKFESCSFNQTSITYSEFERITFVNCDFTNSVISDSKFVECHFYNCKTSNKLIESSLLFDCSFSQMDFNSEFISENFGVEKKQLNDCRFRIKEGRKTKKYILPNEATQTSLKSDMPPIEKFRWEFFNSAQVLANGSDVIDKTFELDSWIEISRNANRFRLLIEKYHEFLVYQYEKDVSPLWNLIKLHNMTGRLSELIDPIKFVEASRALLGVHMSLVRVIEPYYESVARIADNCVHENQIKLLVNGPLDKEYYEKELSPVLSGTSMRIEKVIKHNSPNELHIWVDRIRECAPFIALVLAVKGKIALSKIEGYLKPTDTKKIKKAEKPRREEKTAIDIIKTEFGFDNKVNAYAFKLQALLPGEHLFTIHLGLRTSILGKIKKIIIDLFPSSGLKVSK